MSIQRFKQEAKTFEFGPLKVGIRLPTTAEMEQITKLREPYYKSLRRVLKDPDGSEHDYKSLMAMQVFISKTLCCDPNDPTNPWFAKDAEEQEQLAKNGVNKDKPEDVPHMFHVMASEAFTNLFEKEAADRQAEDPSKPADPTAETAAVEMAKEELPTI